MKTGDQKHKEIAYMALSVLWGAGEGVLTETEWKRIGYRIEQNQPWRDLDGNGTETERE